MSQKPIQTLCQLLVLAIVVAVSMARPSEILESQVCIFFFFSLSLSLFTPSLSFSFSFFQKIFSYANSYENQIFHYSIQAVAENEAASIADLEKIYNSFYRPLQYTAYDEPNSLERSNFQYRPVYQNSIFKSSAANRGSLPLWEPYQQLVTKRQARYRQCYFNPISCFRK